MVMISALVFLAALPMVASPRVASPRRVPAGDWGGAHAKLQVHDAGAIFELDCAHGTIDGALRLEKSGRFEAKGRYQFEGGALMTAEPTEGRPARFSGSLKGKTLTLSIVTEDGRTLGPFQLERGRSAELVKCQ